MIPSMTPSYPSNPPTLIPTAFVSHSMVSLLYNNTKCDDLLLNSGIISDINLTQCIEECVTREWNDCRMINYFDYIKTTSDSKCYLFDISCRISYDFINQASHIWYKELDDMTHINYPSNWTDNVGDDCSIYEEIEWCLNGSIASGYTVSAFELYTNIFSALDSMLVSMSVSSLVCL